MCLIISAPNGSMIPRELLIDASSRNDDGWGVMWFDGSAIQVQKSPDPDPDAIFDLVKKNPHECLVHLRMNTHGDNSLENTHPFEIIPGRLYMMHNGMIDVDAPRHLKRSDTRVVVEDYLQPMIRKPGHLNNPGLRKFIQNMIGESSNRLAFLNDKGEISYFNKNLGIDWRGLWCSNTYAWSLHNEGKRKVYGGSGYSPYASYKDWSIPGDDSYKYDSWFSRGSSSMEPATGIDWADKDTQARADDEEPDTSAKLADEADVQTTFGFKVPVWVAEYLDAEFDTLANCTPEDLAIVLEYLRDNYIGDPL